MTGDIRRESQSTEETFPTHEEIEQRAYEIYLDRGCEQGRALDHWFTAEEQLMREGGAGSAHVKAATIVVAPDGTAETTPERDIAIADEEMAQVRASEELKEERLDPQRARAASVRHQRSR